MQSSHNTRETTAVRNGPSKARMWPQDGTQPGRQDKAIWGNQGPKKETERGRRRQDAPSRREQGAALEDTAGHLRIQRRPEFQASPKKSLPALSLCSVQARAADSYSLRTMKAATSVRGPENNTDSHVHEGPCVLVHSMRQAREWGIDVDGGLAPSPLSSLSLTCPLFPSFLLSPYIFLSLFPVQHS